MLRGLGVGRRVNREMGVRSYFKCRNAAKNERRFLTDGQGTKSQ